MVLVAAMAVVVAVEEAVAMVTLIISAKLGKLRVSRLIRMVSSRLIVVSVVSIPLILKSIILPGHPTLQPSVCLTTTFTSRHVSLLLGLLLSLHLPILHPPLPHLNHPVKIHLVKLALSF